MDVVTKFFSGGAADAPIGRRRWRAAGAAVAVLTVGAGGAAVYVAEHHGAGGRPVVDASSTRCSLAGTPRRGAQTFAVHNSGQGVVGVYVTGTGEASSVVYGEVDKVGPGTYADLAVSVAAGRYVVWCHSGLSGNGHAVDFEVRGAALPPAVGRVRTIPDDFAAPVARYRSFVGEQLGQLTDALADLRTRLQAGELAAARDGYVTAHSHYERIGAVYDAFGDLDGSINGLADGLAHGEADEGFTGFHKLEAQLWAPSPELRDATATVDRLATDVATLRSQLDTFEIDPVTYVIRAHEILENALQEQVTGLSEPHSHRGIDDAEASAAGARTVLDTLRELIESRDAALWARLAGGLDRLDGALAALRAPSGGHVADDVVDRPRRAELTGAMSALLQDLALLPGLIEPRNNS